MTEIGRSSYSPAKDEYVAAKLVEANPIKPYLKADIYL